MTVYLAASGPDPAATPAGGPDPETGAGPEPPDSAEAAQLPAVRGRGLRILLPVVVSVLVAFVVVTGYLMISEPRGAAEVGRWGETVPVSAQPSEDMAGAPNPFRTAPEDLRGPPTRLRVTAIGVDTTLERLRLGANGELQPPTGNEHAGWYADGTAPGDVGPAVLAGHVDSKQGPAVFYRLREISPGDKIEVTRGDRTVTFTVTFTAWYPKRAFPTDVVYGPTPDRQLRIITCGGVFDKTLRSYKDNLVVYAVAG